MARPCAALWRPAAGRRARPFQRGVLDPEIATTEEAIRVFRALGARFTTSSCRTEKESPPMALSPRPRLPVTCRYDGVHYGYRADEDTMLTEFEHQRKEVANRDELDTALVRMFGKREPKGLAPRSNDASCWARMRDAGYYDAYYLKALKVRRLIRNDFDAAFQER